MPAPTEALRVRAFQFACAVVETTLSIRAVPGVRSVVDQLVRSATSVGANLEEAKAASTRRESIRFVEIALREAREGHYRLRIALRVRLVPADHVQPLAGEADQLIRILPTIVLDAKRSSGAAVALSAF